MSKRLGAVVEAAAVQLAVEYEVLRCAGCGTRTATPSPEELRQAANSYPIPLDAQDLLGWQLLAPATHLEREANPGAARPLCPPCVSKALAFIEGLAK